MCDPGRFRFSAVSLWCIVFLLGCGEVDRTAEHEWTVEQDALTLERDLLVSETDAFYFGSVSNVAVAGDGHMFALDWDARDIKVLRPDGVLINSIGHEGQGPGVFQRPRDIDVARGDSLFVYDAGSRRISVFSPSGDVVYGVPLETGGAAVEELMVPNDAPGFVLTLASFPAPGSSEGEGTYTVQRIDASGVPGDTLVTGPPRETISIDKGDFYVFHFVPFDVQPYVALGPAGHAHVGRTDSLRLNVYSLAGAHQRSVAIPHEPVPITDEERADKLEDTDSEVRSQVGDKMPETKPAFRDVFLDDQGRYWFRRPTAHADSTDWWVGDPETDRVVTTRLSAAIDLQVVQDGYAYGRTTKEGAPALVRYRI
jgi:hypothetical protein